MTLSYRLLGIPRSIDEVVDKADRTGRIPDVFARRYSQPSLDVGKIYKYQVGVKVGRARLTTSEWMKDIRNYVPGVDSLPWELEAEDNFAISRAEELAEEIATSGNTNRTVKINGRPYNLRSLQELEEEPIQVLADPGRIDTRTFLDIFTFPATPLFVLGIPGHMLDGWREKEPYSETIQNWRNGFRLQSIPLAVCETIGYWPGRGLKEALKRVSSSKSTYPLNPQR